MLKINLIYLYGNKTKIGVVTLSIFKNKHKEIKYKDNKFIKKERKLFSVYIEIEPILGKAKSGYSIRYFNNIIDKSWESYLYRNGKDPISIDDKGKVFTYKAIVEVRAQNKETLHNRLNEILEKEHEETIVSYNPNKQSMLSKKSSRSVGISARRETKWKYVELLIKIW